MIQARWFSAVALTAAVVAVTCGGCSSTPPATGCVAGTSQACSCSNGKSGAQTCKTDGTFDACACTGTPDAGTDAASDSGCVAETDPGFCTRLAKNCESVTAADNCGVSRTAACGTCSGNTPLCISNVCTAPVCGTNYGGAGTVVTSLASASNQQGLLGVSATGGSVLYVQGSAGCLNGTSPLIIADASAVSFPTQPNYTKQTITAVAGLAGFKKTQQTMSLSGDGLTIIGVAGASATFLSSKRSAVGQIDFAAAAANDFATLNAALPAGGSIAYPVQSSDGLAFYYQVSGATNATLNGIYESTRTLTTAQFPAGQKMPVAVQAFEAVTGISSDHLTLFVTAGFSTSILNRTSQAQPFAASAITPPAAAFRVTPIATCGTLFGTCEPGGCAGEAVCIWNKQ